MRPRGIIITATLALALVLGVNATAAFGAQKPRHIVDAKYKISFYTPSGWANATITTSSSSTTKLLVINSASGLVSLVQVQVLSGRYIAAPDIAASLRQAGATVMGSHLVHFNSLRDVEQLSFSQVSSGVLIFGTLEGFYENAKTYYVSIDSNSTPTMDSTLKKVMDTWGS